MGEMRHKTLMVSAIHWDFCHSYRPQHGGSRILARASCSRAQFWARHSGRVRGVSFCHFSLSVQRHRYLLYQACCFQSHPSSQVIVDPIKRPHDISTASAPSSSRGSSSLPGYPLFVSVDFVPNSTDRRKLPKPTQRERKEKRARLVPRMISFAVPWIPKARPCGPSGTSSPPPRRWVFGPGTPAPPRRGPSLRGVGPSFRLKK